MHRMVWWLYAVAAVVVFLILAGAIVQAAEERDPERAVFCALVARELVRIEVESGQTYTPVLVEDVLHYKATPDKTLRDITPPAALQRLLAHMRLCETMIDMAPSLPRVPAASNDAWARAVVTLKQVANGAGTAPAGEGPVGWAEACGDQWRTFDPSDGTVVRPASKGGKQRCPLVKGPNGDWIIPNQ